MKEISLIIVNYNGATFLADLLESMKNQSRLPDEIILVDNASVDGSVELVRNSPLGIRIISLESNVGFAQANNIGFRESQGRYILLLNSDTVISPNFIEEMHKALRFRNELGAVVAKIIKACPEGTIDAVGAEFNNLGQCWSRGFNEKISNGCYEQATEVAGITACATMVRRKALTEHRLFDPDFFMYYEELELTLRLRGRGWGIWYVPNAVALHRGGASISQSQNTPLLFRQYYGNRNRAKILAKFYPLGHLLRYLPLICLSFLYWNWMFFKRAGISFSLKAGAAQFHFALKGLLERRQAGAQYRKWLPWMTRHNLRDVAALGAALQLR